MDAGTFLIQCLNAVQYGLLLFLVASGLTLIFGIMGVINLAHGSFYMVGAYLTYGLAKMTGSLWLAIPIGVIIAFAIGTRRFGWQAGVALVAMAAAGAVALLLW